MAKHTPLYESHMQHHGQMVDFAGWELPLHYGSQLAEHQQVREDVGIFDVSHMGIIDIQGDGAADFLSIVLANNIAKLKTPLQALYSCMLNEKAGVIDDLIAYYLSPNNYRVVVNAARTEIDLAWLNKQVSYYNDKNKTSRCPVSVVLQKDLGILAIQGPNAREKIGLLFPGLQEKIQTLKPFQCFLTDATFLADTRNLAASSILVASSILIARTGYTGEDGLEIILPKSDLISFWNVCMAASIPPIGLGARDTLRLEAGLNLYGQDMDESVSPFESNLAWTVALEPQNRNFIGRPALAIQQAEGIPQKLVGIVLLDEGVLRHGQRLLQDNECIGIVTSGGFSPTLKKSIALARIHSNIQKDCLVKIRDHTLAVKIVRPPFVRRGHEKNTEGT